MRDRQSIQVSQIQIQMKKSNINQKHFYEVFSVDSYLSTGISKGEILELKDAFDLLDSNSTGSIDPMELRNIFKAFGIDQKNLSLEIALSDATSSPKPIDFASFLQIFTAYFYAPKSRASYKKVFKLFDDENMGCITAKNLRRVMKELNLQVSQVQLEQMVQRADQNDDGVITEEQFYQIMTRISSKI